MKNKKVMAAVAAVAVIIIAAVIIGNRNKGKNEENIKDAEYTESSQTAQIVDSDEAEESDISETEGTESQLESELNVSNTEGGSNDGEGSSYDSSTNANFSETDGDLISFPYEAKVDPLRLVGLSSYSGYFIEDGSDSEIENVAALQVVNTSNEVMEYAKITLNNGDQNLEFEVSLLPAGSTCIVLETNRRSYNESSSLSYVGSQIAYMSSLDMKKEFVETSVDENGMITVKNVSSKDISELRLFYKNRFETGEYVGGIAYNVKMENLAVGESVTIQPSHFDPEYGEIMMVRIYD